MSTKIYLAVVVTAFAAMVVMLNCLPRSRFSELEKRELAAFPEFSLDALKSGALTGAVSSWYSDTEPFRDKFMTLSMRFDHLLALDLFTPEEERITFHAADRKPVEKAPEPEPAPTPEPAPEPGPAPEPEAGAENREVGEYTNKVTADANAKIAHAGILIVGKEPRARALMAFGGGAEGGASYAESANLYKRTFPDVNVYVMPIPTAIEFYCPDSARKPGRSQRAMINNIFRRLDPSVHAVDIHTTLGRHAAEDIYLRTDHHWAPLGAFYAAKRFCAVANVPFPDLDAYDRKVVQRFVGSMYGYSRDIAIKNSPEDFVYYEPNRALYTTTYINYRLDRKYRVTGESLPVRGPYFIHFGDGSGGAYNTFMGGDAKITKVETNVNNGRRVLIMKDSFGNAVPGYRFYSFEQVHVIDFRYFTRDMHQYVRENKITDILFCNNVFSCYANAASGPYTRFLSRRAQPRPASQWTTSTTRRLTPLHQGEPRQARD